MTMEIRIPLSDFEEFKAKENERKAHREAVWKAKADKIVKEIDEIMLLLTEARVRAVNYQLEPLPSLWRRLFEAQDRLRDLCGEKPITWR